MIQMKKIWKNNFCNKKKKKPTYLDGEPPRRASPPRAAPPLRRYSRSSAPGAPAAAAARGARSHGARCRHRRSRSSALGCGRRRLRRSATGSPPRAPPRRVGPLMVGARRHACRPGGRAPRSRIRRRNEKREKGKGMERESWSGRELKITWVVGPST